MAKNKSKQQPQEQETGWGIRILDEKTFEAKPLTEERAYREMLFPVEPSGIMYLVRVYGKTGDSNGSSDTYWDVDIFSSEEEAEALAVAIDENYDLHNVISDLERYGGFYGKKRTHPKDEDLEIPEHRLDEVPASRHKLIRDTFVAYAKSGFDPKFLEPFQSVKYFQNGQELSASTYPWRGYFERLNQVEVMPLRRITEKSPEILRRRRW